MSFAESLRDPVVLAIPVFLAFMALEVLSLRFLDEEDTRRARGRRAATSAATPAPTS